MRLLLFTQTCLIGERKAWLNVARTRDMYGKTLGLEGIVRVYHTYLQLFVNLTLTTDRCE